MNLKCVRRFLVVPSKSLHFDYNGLEISKNILSYLWFHARKSCRYFIIFLKYFRKLNYFISLSNILKRSSRFLLSISNYLKKWLRWNYISISRTSSAWFHNPIFLSFHFSIEHELNIFQLTCITDFNHSHYSHVIFLWDVSVPKV